ncbi:MAG: hypothetical protein R2991_03415 [Thermoanaerobaculia bacterium]
MSCGSGRATSARGAGRDDRDHRPRAAGGLADPLPEGGRLDRLRVSGEIEEATDALVDLPEPLVLEAGAEPPSAVLARLRRDER